MITRGEWQDTHSSCLAQSHHHDCLWGHRSLSLNRETTQAQSMVLLQSCQSFFVRLAFDQKTPFFGSLVQAKFATSRKDGGIMVKFPHRHGRRNQPLCDRKFHAHPHLDVNKCLNHNMSDEREWSLQESHTPERARVLVRKHSCRARQRAAVALLLRKKTVARSSLVRMRCWIPSRSQFRAQRRASDLGLASNPAASSSSGQDLVVKVENEKCMDLRAKTVKLTSSMYALGRVASKLEDVVATTASDSAVTAQAAETKAVKENFVAHSMNFRKAIVNRPRM